MGMPSWLAVVLIAPLIVAGVVGALVGAIMASVAYKKSQMGSIPTFPEWHWLFGHWSWFTTGDVWVRVHEMAKSLGPIYYYRIADIMIVMVSDPAEVTRISCRGDHFLDKAVPAYDAFNKIHFGPHSTNILSMGTTDTWKVLRKATSACFATQHMKAAFSVAQDITNTIFEQVEQAGPGQVWNVTDLARRITAEVICGWGFRISAGATDLSKTNELVHYMDGMREALHRLWMNPFWLMMLATSSKARERRNVCKKYDNYMADLTRQLQARPLEEQPETTLGGALLRATDPKTGKPLSFHDLKSNVAVLLGAGFETSASAITSAVLLLLANPKAMQLLEAELDKAGLLKTAKRPNPRPVEWTDLPQLTYSNAVVKETLRMMPPAALGSFRLTDKPTIICGHTVPAGTWVGMPSCAIDKSTAVYGEDAEQFRPERWIDSKAASTWAATGAYDEQVPDSASQGGRLKEPLAFSVGPRDCVGQSLARLEMQLVIPMLLARFVPRLAPGMNASNPEAVLQSMEYHVTLSKDDGVWMHLEAR